MAIAGRREPIPPILPKARPDRTASVTASTPAKLWLNFSPVVLPNYGQPIQPLFPVIPPPQPTAFIPPWTGLIVKGSTLPNYGQPVTPLFPPVEPVIITLIPFKGLILNGATLPNYGQPIKPYITLGKVPVITGSLLQAFGWQQTINGTEIFPGTLTQGFAWRQTLAGSGVSAVIGYVWPPKRRILGRR